jgi:hypothetical protein
MGTKHTKQKLAWRHRNPEKRRAQRQRHYDKTKIVTKPTKIRPTGVPHRVWTEYEINFMCASMHICTDRSIAKELNRSVHAIQQKRYKLRRQNENFKA